MMAVMEKLHADWSTQAHRTNQAQDVIVRKAVSPRDKQESSWTRWDFAKARDVRQLAPP